MSIMAKIKRVTMKETKGIRNELSGSIPILINEKTGVIKGIKNPIRVKRPNQYKG